MKRILFYFLVTLSSILLSFSSHAQVVINEVCSANADINHDPDYHNFSGWIELHNTGSQSLNIGGYYLTDNPEILSKWRVPYGVTVPANGYLLIWCDERNAGRHTNFSLDSDGEDLILSNTALAEVDAVKFPKQITNISYGRTGDGTSWNFTMPTPAAANNIALAPLPLAKPLISLTSGRYTGSQQVTLTHQDAKAGIYYTLDGSEPSIAALKYAGAISITQTQTLKAKAYREGYIPSSTETETYFIGEHAFTLPVVSISTDPVYLWDNFIGIYTNGTNGVIGNCQSTPFNWNRDWDRHATITFLDKSGEKRFHQDVDIRIGGACSRANPQKSFAVKARDKYGDNTINDKIFDSKPFSYYGGFMFRNSGNDFWSTMFRDALMHELVIGQMDIDYLAYEPRIFYLNGVYWGIQNIREKIDGDYFEANYGVDKDDLDLGEWLQANEGSVDAFLNYLNVLQGMDLSSPEAFQYIDENIDVQEFINYLTAEIFYCNTDWPGNNVKYWRQRSTNGKWRWILWDLDFGFGMYPEASYPTHPTLHFATEANGPQWPNPPWATMHLRLLIQNPEFRNRFIQTLTASLSTTFSPERIIDKIDELQGRIAAEIPYHTARWGQSSAFWSTEVQRLRDFATQRNEFMRGYIPGFFGLPESFVRISVQATPSNGGTFQLNGINEKEQLSNVDIFSSQTYTVTPHAAAGYKFDHWKITKRESTFVNLIETGGIWKYDDTGNESISWQLPDFHDGHWMEGPSILGYGDDNLKTFVSYGSDPNNKQITTYFRKSFSVNDTTGFEALTAKVLFDDGVIVYLNGEEVFRGNMPDGTVSFTTTALSASPENIYTTFTIPRGKLKPGVNVLAAEIHQVSGQSSDIVFDFELATHSLGNEVSFTTEILTIKDTAYADVSLEAIFEIAAPQTGLVVNEIAPAGTTHSDEDGNEDDWIELYNNSDKPIDLAGMFVTDNLSKKYKYQIPTGKGNATVIGPAEYKILWADEEPNEGALHVNMKLSADGEAFGIYQKSGEELLTIEEIPFAKVDFIGSYSRIPNLTGPFVSTSASTPMNENVFEVPVGTENLHEQKIQLYPNPVKDFFSLTSANVISSITILSASGVLVKMFPAQGTHHYTVSDLPSGVYFVMITMPTGLFRTKFVKQ